jgi:membrane protein implicated in regulation of membrane protease activity
MSWSDFYLFCFLIGFSLSAISFLAGAVHLHLPFKMHFPFHLTNHGGIGHSGAAHGSAEHGSSSAKGSAHLSWFNAATVLAFLAWFGGTGYLLSKHSILVGAACLSVAVAAGLLAGWLVYRFMYVLVRNTDAHMNEWDYRHEGSVGTVSMTIPACGTGEVIFEQHGIRRSAGARSDNASSIERGTEVVISRYEKGIAYVKKWDEFTGEEV